jgi:Carboxymuconolactone decarboxylase family
MIMASSQFCFTPVVVHAPSLPAGMSQLTRVRGSPATTGIHSSKSQIEEDPMSYPSPYTAKVTVPLPSYEEIRAVIGDSYNPDRALNVIKMFAGTQEFYPALIGMVQAIFGTPDIDAKHREVIILRAAAVLDVPYEWQANEQMAGNAGLTPAEIDALASDGPVKGIDTEYVIITAATDDMLTGGTLKDQTLQQLLDTFGVVVTRKYIATIAWFSLLGLFLNATRVPMETTDKIGARTTPLE